ncbi:MAG: hypothetical protein C0623_11835 [Desulfuromonas sp.]|nr:MAG: hypothetical protein C0623_11835 [Desulfuromonas sp.]
MGKPSKSKQVLQINSLLEQILADKGLDSKLKKYKTWSIWDDVVGPQIARHAQPLRIRDSVLEVRVAHATWMQQLQLLKPRILKELNDRLGDKTLSDIYWKRGDISIEQEPVQPKQRPLPELSGEQKENINRITAEIDDRELQHRLRELLAVASRHENNDSQD